HHQRAEPAPLPRQRAGPGLRQAEALAAVSPLVLRGLGTRAFQPAADGSPRVRWPTALSPTARRRSGATATGPASTARTGSLPAPASARLAGTRTTTTTTTRGGLTRGRGRLCHASTVAARNNP